MRLLAPAVYMIAISWVSSIPGSGDVAGGFIFQAITPGVQNLLHIPAFALLLLLWAWALKPILKQPLQLSIALLITSGFAAIDEWHQSFVPGRFGSITDFGLDLLGAAIMALWLLRLQNRQTTQQP